MGGAAASAARPAISKVKRRTLAPSLCNEAPPRLVGRHGYHTESCYRHQPGAAGGLRLAGAQVIAHRELAKVIRGGFRSSAVKIVLDGQAGTPFHQKLHHRQVAVLRGDVERGDALSVRQAAEGGLLIDGAP